MTRQEEIINRSIEYGKENPSEYDDERYDLSDLEFAFEEGAKWADQHPKEGLVDVERVEQWIKDCFAFLNDAGHHNFKVDKFIENFRIAMEE